MTLYKNAFPTTYEEIKRYFPSWYTDVLEMDSIWRAQGKQFDAVRTAIDGVVSNRFIAHADEATISELERFIRITPSAGQTLEERRMVVSTALKGSNNHIGAPEIREIVGRFIGEGEVTVTFLNGTIFVDVEKPFTSTGNYVACYNALANVIPAHLALQMELNTTLRRDSGLYIGFVMRTTRSVAFDMPEVDTENLFVLTDENDEILYDENGEVLMDGLEVIL